jgi:hypothetical protein
MPDTVRVSCSVSSADLAGRRWVRLPGGADPVWTAYWTGGAQDGTSPVMRTIQECQQAALWNGTSALAPVDHPMPAGLVVPFSDRPPSALVVAWPKEQHGSRKGGSFPGFVVGGRVADLRAEFGPDAATATLLADSETSHHCVADPRDVRYWLAGSATRRPLRFRH